MLITLAIIGIIAAMTIPTLHSKYQKREMEAKLTQFYSLMSNSIKMFMAEEGCSDMYCAGWSGDFRTEDEDGNWIAGALQPVAAAFSEKYLRPVKHSWGNCSNPKTRYKALDGGTPPFWHGSTDSVCETAYCHCLPNGMKIGFPTNGTSGCKAEYRDKDICSNLNVDLNGDKGPNRMGYDIFYFRVLKDGTITGRNTLFGGEMECDSPSESSGRRYGIGCAVRAMKNGWKIDYWD